MRLTQWTEKMDGYLVGYDQVQYNEKQSAHVGEAIEKLAKYENFHAHLLHEQKVISEKLESLRTEGKTRTTTFKQLVAAKLTNSHMLLLLEKHGL